MVVVGCGVLALGLMMVGFVVVVVLTLLGLLGGGVVHQCLIQNTPCPYLHGCFTRASALLSRCWQFYKFFCPACH